jgi:hypothetical protein
VLPCAEREWWVETFARYIRAISETLLSRDVNPILSREGWVVVSGEGWRWLSTIAFSLMDDYPLSHFVERMDKRISSTIWLAATPLFDHAFVAIQQA